MFKVIKAVSRISRLSLYRCSTEKETLLMGISEYKQAQAAMDDDKFYLAEALLHQVKGRLSTQVDQK